jgi:preprotein translocase subunit SecY
MKKIFVIILLLFPAVGFAQTADAADQFGNFLRESGKLYVVFAVIIIIFAAIISMLIRQELKLNRLEKKSTNKK